MRVVHFCTKFNRISETFIYDLVVGLERAGVENHVLTAARVHAEERPFARVRVLPLSVKQQAAFVLGKRCLNRYRFPLPAAAREALAQIRPDLVLAHFGGAGAAIGPAARELRIPVVVVFHAFDLFLRHFRPANYAALWAGGAHAVAVSEHGKRRLLELGCPAGQIRVIHCGVDVSRFVPAPHGQSGTGPLRLVTVARLVEKKGLEDLIRALHALRGVSMPVQLDIWGDGPLRRRLADLARRQRLNEAVRFRGAIASRDVPRLLCRYDAFVLPSKTARNGDTEGIPLTILEAQAAGLPVVSTLHGGIPEGLPPGNRGLLARQGDVPDLAAKLALLAAQRNDRNRIGLRGRDWVIRRFSLAGELAAYQRLFQEILARPQNRPLSPPREGG